MGIKKLAKNKYQARYFAGYNSKGKRIYPSKTFTTLKDANTWLTAKLRAKHLGEYAEPSTLTLAEYLDQWLETKKHSLRENTLYTYKGLIDQYVRHEIGHLKLTAVRAHHVQQWQATLLNRISARTVIGVRATLNSALSRALKQGLIGRNPITDAETVRFERIEKQCLDPRQAIAFMSVCQGQIGLLLKFGLNTGLRPEELIAVRWKDLELEGKGVVHVRQVVIRLSGGGWRTHKPKTGNSVRRVGLPSFLLPELREHRRAQLEKKLKVGRHYKDNDLVFASSVGTPLTRPQLWYEFKQTLERAGLPTSIRLYDLRHSFVTLSLAAGVDLKTVSEEAGHATVAFTLDHYGHVLQVMRDAAVEKREILLAAHQTQAK